MNTIKKIVFLSFLFFSIASSGQFKFKNGKRLGIVMGIHAADIKNKHVDFTSQIGISIGLMLSPNYEKKWNMIYGLEYFRSSVSATIRTRGVGVNLTELDYELSGVQAKALVSYSVYKTHVSIELGPVLQFNSELKENLNTQGGFYGASPAVNWNQFDKINKTNINGYFGISAGNKKIRGIVFCQYGINNMFNKVNDQTDYTRSGPYEGHFTMIGGQLLLNIQ